MRVLQNLLKEGVSIRDLRTILETLADWAQATHDTDILTEYVQPFEMAGTGEIKDGKPHIHCILGREGDTALAGHLHWAHVQNWFVNVYVLKY